LGLIPSSVPTFSLEVLDKIGPTREARRVHSSRLSRTAEARKALRPLKNTLEIRSPGNNREVLGTMLVAKVVRTMGVSRRLPGISPTGERLGVRAVNG